MGTPSDDPIEGVTDRFMREAGLDRRHPGLEEDGAEALDEALRETGARVDELVRGASAADPTVGEPPRASS